MKGICYIVSAGDCTGINIMKKEGDYIIAADGGYLHLQKNKIVPDLILGDFDSLGFVPDGENVAVHKPEKDDTDTMLAVKEGIRLGYRDFTLLGALGGRLDHTIANLSVLSYLSKKGMKGNIVSEHMMITAVTNDEVKIPKKEQGIFSVFSLDEKASGVSIAGAKYEITQAELTNDVPLGVSNEFVGKEVSVMVEQGTLIVMWYV